MSHSLITAEHIIELKSRIQALLRCNPETAAQWADICAMEDVVTSFEKNDVISSNIKPLRPQNPFEAARLKLIKKLLALKVPAGIPAFPLQGDFEAAKAHLIEAASIFDEWLTAFGHEMRHTAPCAIDRDLFAGTFADAIDGNETYAVERCADAVTDNRRVA